MGKCRIDNTGNGIKAMETWKAKMQDMSWEAEGMKAKCRNPGNQDDCNIYVTSSIYDIKAMETWKAKMLDMSWEAEEMRSKCRNPGN